MQDPEADFTFDEEPSSAARRLALPLGIIAFSLFIIFSSCYVVDEKSVGVVTRFGRHVRTSHPGICFKLPWPIEYARIENVTEIRTVQMAAKAPADLLAADGQPMICTARIRYKINPTEIHQYLFNTYSTDAIVHDLALSAIRTATAGLAARQILSEQADLQLRAETALHELIARYPIGVQLVSLQIQKLAYPPEAAAACESVMEARKNAAATIGGAEQCRVRTQADTEHKVAGLLSQARLDAEKRIVRAKAEVERFDQLLDGYHANPETVRQALYVETIGKLLPAVGKVLLEDTSPGPPTSKQEGAP